MDVMSTAAGVIGKIKAVYSFYQDFRDNSDKNKSLYKRLDVLAENIEMVAKHDLGEQEGPFLKALKQLEDTMDKALEFMKKYQKRNKVVKFFMTASVKRDFDRHNREMMAFEGSLQTTMDLLGMKHNKEAKSTLDEILGRIEALRVEVRSTQTTPGGSQEHNTGPRDTQHHSTMSKDPQNQSTTSSDTQDNGTKLCDVQDCSPASRDTQDYRLHTEASQIQAPTTQGDQGTLKHALITNRQYIIEYTDPSNGLLDVLIARRVLTIQDMEEITINATTFQQMSKLLNFLNRRPAQDVQHFLSGLRETNQGHVADQIEMSCR